MKREHINTVRVEEKVHHRILLTRFGTRRGHRMLCEVGPLTRRMQPGQVCGCDGGRARSRRNRST